LLGYQFLKFRAAATQIETKLRHLILFLKEMEYVCSEYIPIGVQKLQDTIGAVVSPFTDMKDELGSSLVC